MLEEANKVEDPYCYFIEEVIHYSKGIEQVYSIKTPYFVDSVMYRDINYY